MDDLDDTPVFRERVAYLESQTKALKEEIKGLIAQAKLYVKAGLEFGEVGRSFAQKTLEFRKVIPAVEDIGQTLKNLSDLMHTVHVQLTACLTEPLEKLLSDIKLSKQLKNVLEHAEDEYYCCLSKSLSIKSDADPAMQDQIDREVMKKKGHFDILRFEYMGQLTDLTARRRLSLLNWFGKFLDDQTWFFNKGLNLLQEAQPAIGKLLEDVREGQERAEQERAERGEIRMRIMQAHKDEEASLQPPLSARGPRPPVGLIRDLHRPPVQDKTTVEKRGWLGKVNRIHRGRSTGRFDHRRFRYWSVLSSGKLFLYKDWKCPPRHVFELLLCAVRELPQAPERHCFEIISPSNNRMLQAQNHKEMMQWIAVIQNASSKMIDQQVPRNALQDASGLAVRLAALREVPGNESCADCGASDPQWGSLNLGAVVCLECSGIHRALGVHISRVRSLVLDTLEESVILVLTGIGNERVNSIYLDRPTSDFGIHPESTREAKERHIRAKYEARAYVAGAGGRSADELGAAMHAAARSGDLEQVVRLIACGASVNWTSPDDGAQETAVMEAVMGGSAAGVELLLQNGADMTAQDALGRTALHYAAQEDRADCTRVLVARGGSPMARDAYGKTPLDVAAERGGAAFEVLVSSMGLAVGQPPPDDEEGGSPTETGSPPHPASPRSPNIRPASVAVGSAVRMDSFAGGGEDCGGGPGEAAGSRYSATLMQHGVGGGGDDAGARGSKVGDSGGRRHRRTASGSGGLFNRFMETIQHLKNPAPAASSATAPAASTALPAPGVSRLGSGGAAYAGSVSPPRRIAAAPGPTG